MSLHSTISLPVSPLLWLAPLPFVLALCLPAPPRANADAPHPALAAAPVQTLAQAASAPPAR